MKLINSINNKFNNIIKLGKDELDNLDPLNAVYKIKCHNFPVSYVGQTGRSTGRRMRIICQL